MTRFDKEIVATSARRFRRREAQGARCPRREGRRFALSRRAQRQGRQGRPARSQHAVLDRQIRLPRPRAGGARAGRAVHAGGVAAVPALRGVPVARALPHAFRHRPRRGAPDLRSAAAASPSASASRRAAACRRVERFMKAYFLVAKDVGDLTAIVCAELEARQAEAAARSRPRLRPLPAQARRRVRRSTTSSSTTTASTCSTRMRSSAIRST